VIFEPPYPIMPLPEDMWDEEEPDPDNWHDQQQFDRACEELGL